MLLGEAASLQSLSRQVVDAGRRREQKILWLHRGPTPSLKVAVPTHGQGTPC